MLNEVSIRVFMAVTGVFADIKDALNNDERGQDLLEYALLGGLIAAALLAASLFLVPAIAALGSAITACVDFTQTTDCSTIGV